MRGRRGFTFIEMLTVMIVMGILATLAILRYIDLRDRATASGMASELNGIRLAAYNYWASRAISASAGPGIPSTGRILSRRMDRRAAATASCRSA